MVGSLSLTFVDNHSPSNDHDDPPSPKKKKRKNRRKSSNSGSPDEEKKVKFDPMGFKVDYEYNTLKNDPLHKQPEKLNGDIQMYRDQGCYINSMYQMKTEELREYITRPVPKQLGKVMFTIIRNKSGMNRWYPRYTLIAYVSDENGQTYERGI